VSSTLPLLLLLTALGPFVRLGGGPVVVGGHSESKQPGAADRRIVIAIETFDLAPHPVTNAEYARFLNDGHEDLYDSRSGLLRTTDGFRPGTGKDAHPVVYVNWYAARIYARWAGGRLPMAAELELAGRGRAQGESLDVPEHPDETVLEGALYGGGSPPPANNKPLGYANTIPISGDQLQFPAGIWEWTQDALPARGAKEDQRLIVVKGGGRMDPIENFEVWMNDVRPATLSSSDLGFRIARSPGSLGSGE
jgi:formylglycine-generating enzyme required for sulfatase activity